MVLHSVSPWKPQYGQAISKSQDYKYKVHIYNFQAQLYNHTDEPLYCRDVLINSFCSRSHHSHNISIKCSQRVISVSSSVSPAWVLTTSAVLIVPHYSRRPPAVAMSLGLGHCNYEAICSFWTGNTSTLVGVYIYIYIIYIISFNSNQSNIS